MPSSTPVGSVGIVLVFDVVEKNGFPLLKGRVIDLARQEQGVPLCKKQTK